jgi:hypothetical protein
MQAKPVPKRFGFDKQQIFEILTRHQSGRKKNILTVSTNWFEYTKLFRQIKQANLRLNN